MLHIKIVFLLAVLNIFVLKIQCNSCNENAGYLRCESCEDFVLYQVKGNPFRVIIGREENSVGTEKACICTKPVFSSVKSVEHLTLSNASVWQFSPQCMHGLNALKIIDLAYNELTSIDLSAFRTSAEMKINTIQLHSNNIVDLDFTRVELPELVVFNASRNHVISVKLKSQNIPVIDTMDLSRNQISLIEMESGLMRELNLSYNKITLFEGKNFVLPRLYTLDLTHNRLTSITPDMLVNVRAVRKIYLAHNFIHTSSLPGFDHIRILDFSYNSLNSVDNVSFMEETKVERLILNSNRVYQLLTNQPYFKKVERFYCNTCYIINTESYIFEGIFSEIKYLSLESNHITTADLFQARISGLALRWIKLSKNNIRKIKNTDFEKLTNVKTLYLDNNEITRIAPRAFDLMKNLNKLVLSNNLILKLQFFSPRFQDLKYLDVSGNNMAFFEIPGLTERIDSASQNYAIYENLNTLVLFSNPLQCKCVDMIRSWAKNKETTLLIDDESVRNGTKPSCIINEDGCKANISIAFIRDLWYLFNDKKIRNAVDDSTEDL
ncbi:hypothetical protein DMENIID0001_002120 [Sergentomyia squamirostris]